MPRTHEAPFSQGRLEELALRAQKTGRAQFSPFLSPPEADRALLAARKAGVACTLFGGYEDAERQMARFVEPEAGGEEAFPIVAVELRWPHQSAPQHRDLLGSVLGLGIERHCVGDIVFVDGSAYLFAQSAMAAHIADSLAQAGRVKLQTALADSLPEVPAPEGMQRRDTVSSLRLDAVVASGLGMSRAKAAQLIASGHVKLRHLPTLRVDAHVEEGDTISVRGMGRLRLEKVGALTRKGRLPVTMIRFGVR